MYSLITLETGRETLYMYSMCGMTDLQAQGSHLQEVVNMLVASSKNGTMSRLVEESM